MSITENEAIKQLQIGYLGDTEDLVQAKHIAIQALEEIQQYRAIGTEEEFKALKEMTVTQMDIDTFRAYIDDCMDDVAFGNTDWNHSLTLALKCMELHKT